MGVKQRNKQQNSQTGGVYVGVSGYVCWNDNLNFSKLNMDLCFFLSRCGSTLKLLICLFLTHNIPPNKGNFQDTCYGSGM